MGGSKENAPQVVPAGLLLLVLVHSVHRAFTASQVGMLRHLILSFQPCQDLWARDREGGRGEVETTERRPSPVDVESGSGLEERASNLVGFLGNNRCFVLHSFEISKQPWK